jgi:hypothetical protein
MTVDMRAVEDMLYKYAEKLQTEVHGAGGKLLALPTPETPEGCMERAAQLRAVAGDCGYMEEVGAAYGVLRDERQAVERELFAGVWPPTNPLDMLAMWTTLLHDIDGIDRVYFDVGGNGSHPLFAVWDELDAAMLKLKPDTVETATAIYHSWKRDDAEGLGLDESHKRIRRAKALAMADLPRPR